MRSRIELLIKFAGMARSHRGILLNWFRAKKAISSRVMEGLNNDLKLPARKSYGFRTFRVMEIMLYHMPGLYRNRNVPTGIADKATSQRRTVVAQPPVWTFASGTPGKGTTRAAATRSVLNHRL